MNRPEEETVPREQAAPEAAVPAESPASAEDWRDRYLRALAELDNYRKRMERERETGRLYAAEPVLRDLMPLFDALQATLSSGGDAESLRAGIRLALGETFRLLAERGLEPIDALGKPFDPRLHEALGTVPDASAAPGTVVVEIRRGYRLRDRILRPSRVQVSIAPPSGEKA